MQNAEHGVWYVTLWIKREKVKLHIYTHTYSFCMYVGHSGKIPKKLITIITCILGKGWELGGMDRL